MSTYLFIFFISVAVNFIAIIPFINFLYKCKMRRAHQETRDVFNKRTPIFDKHNKVKAGIPVGGGILILFTTVILFYLSMFFFELFGGDVTSIYSNISSEIGIIFFTFISFALLGLYDDVKKMFFIKKGSFIGLRFRHKIILQIILASIISYAIYTNLGVSIIHIPFLGVYDISYLYIPFSTFVIVAFTNAVNVTDGLDGLAGGVLFISLFAFWAISASILDTPLLIFIAVTMGGLLSFLYFNVHPARLFMGDTGALSLGATLAVIGLLLGKIFALAIIGGVFVLEIASSFLQIYYKKIYGKKLFSVAPLHLWFQHNGWEESKIVMRAWIISVLFSAFGLMIAFLR